MFEPIMPASGVLVVLHGSNADTGADLESIDALRSWEPTFEVVRAVIYDGSRRPIEAATGVSVRPDGTYLEYNDGVVSICADGANPIASALEAHEWAFGVTGDTIRIRPSR